MKLKHFIYFFIPVFWISCAEDPIDSDDITYVTLNTLKNQGSTIDINGDLVPDFRLSIQKDSVFQFFDGDIIYVEITGFKENVILTDVQSISNNDVNLRPFVRPIPERTLIGPASDIWENKAIISYQGAFSGQNITKGILTGSGSVFVGVAFDIETKIHYGWLQIENKNINEFNLIDAAFHRTPTISIEVGSQ